MATVLVVFIVWIGVYPRPFIERIEPTVDVLLGRLAKAGATRYLETSTPAAAAVQARAD